MVYKGHIILRTRDIPYYFQNFDSFHALLFFETCRPFYTIPYASKCVYVNGNEQIHFYSSMTFETVRTYQPIVLQL